MNPRSIVAIFCLISWAGLCATAAPIQVGSSEEDVYSVMGAPQGQMLGQAGKILLYAGAGVEIRGGKVYRIDPSLNNRANQRQQQAAAGSGNSWVTQLARGWNWAREKITGGNMPAPVPAVAAVTTPARAPAAAPAPKPNPAVHTISNGGQVVDLESAKVAGKVTVVDFYADWCIPCRLIGSRLQSLTEEDPDLFVTRIDIVNWDSEVARQFEIQSIPHIRVYNRQGQMVGSPTSDFKEVMTLVAQAKE